MRFTIFRGRESSVREWTLDEVIDLLEVSIIELRKNPGRVASILSGEPFEVDGDVFRIELRR